jgi:Carboxypeptidase regulatory-like domain/TonB dependent receptor
MTRGCVTLFAAVLLAVCSSTAAFAQGGSTAPISGVVVDAAGAVVPGADVIVRNNATGETFTAVSSGEGIFSVPSMVTGTYTVTVTLQGFKTVILNNVVVNAGIPASVRAVLEVGGITEQVTVQAISELVQTQTATVSMTLDTRQVANLPLSSRDTSQFIVFLPGVTTPGGTRDSIVNGLPQSTINMTLDGVNIQDNTLKSGDGFFAIVGPRVDSVEEITVTTAATGAEGSGGGATQIRYTTRSGTNTFRGGVFHQYRSDALNTNSYFNKRDNLPKSALRLNQPGFSLGGPIMLPGFNGRNKAFFFVNYEELRQRTVTRRDRTILHPASQLGVFRYRAAGRTEQVNVFELAARTGNISTADPLIAKLLADIRQATTTEGNVRDLDDPLLQEYALQNPVTSMNYYPTARLDYQINAKHRVSYSMHYQDFNGGPDTTNSRDRFFPGFPIQANQTSVRRQASGWLRSIFGANLVNEFRIGYGGAPVIFAQNDFRPEMWSGPVANQGGFHLNLDNALEIANAGAGGTSSARDAYLRSFENTVNWLKGSHSINFGGSFTSFDLWMENQQIVPELRFGIVQGDPAEGMFNTTNFPGASSSQLDDARALYAILSGRISEVRYTARLNDAGEYVPLGEGLQLARQRQVALWAQDAWRVTPNLTVNYGARYDMTFPFIALNNSYSVGDLEDVYGVSGVGNLFKPGTLAGSAPLFRQLEEKERAYPMDWNNVAPSVGLSWTPAAKGGLWRRLVGATGDTAVRAGYSRSFTRLGLSDFTGEIGDNPGVSVNAFRSLSLGNLGQLPLLMRDPSRLTPGEFPGVPTFPYRDVVTGDITIFSPDLRVPYSDTWQAGIQRSVGRSMSIEARYLGARSADNWRTNDYNELNIVENGFLDEFKLAMTNLQANVAAGRGSTFAYFGPNTGTSPLPIFLAYFNGIPRSRAGEAALYTSNSFRSSTFLNPLARFNPAPHTAANALDADANSRNRALAAGLPANFLVVNPDLLGGALIVENRGETMYNSMALEFRRRSANGLAFNSSYVLGHASQTQFLSLRLSDDPWVRNGGAEGDVSHAFKLNAVFPFPFGRGQRWGSGVNRLVDSVIGGWQLAGNARIQSGRLVDLGNVRLIGMDHADLREMFKLRVAPDGKVFMLPQEIIDETVKAFSVSATSASGYGSLGPPSGRYIAPANGLDCIETIVGEGKCGTRSLIVQGPLFKQIDVSLVKRLSIVGRVNAEFRLDALNVFDHVNFAPVGGIGSNVNNYEVTDLTGVNTARVLQVVTRIRF